MTLSGDSANAATIAGNPRMMGLSLSSTISHARGATHAILLAVVLWLPVLGYGQSAEDWARPIEALIARGDLSEARAQLSALDTARRDSYAGLVLSARLAAADQHFEESMNLLARCLATRRDDPEVYKLVANSAIRLKKFATAEMALKDAEKLAPADEQVHFNLGALYYTQSRFRDAKPELERAVALRPDYLPAQLFLGLALEELNGEQAAMEAYRKAIALNEASDGKNELPCLYLGRLLYRLSRIREAEPLLRKATNTNPQSAEAWLWLGKACSSLGQYGEAVSALQRAASADPDLPEPHYVLSRVYLDQHDSQKSAEELARFRELQSGRKKTNDGRRKQPDLAP